MRARERAADNKKIQDLQRQVKEMEQILKRRNPNALPTLIMAAAAAPDNIQPGNRSAYTEVLEKRVKKLEVELEQKDGEADTLLRGVEQKYNAVKVLVRDLAFDKPINSDLTMTLLFLASVPWAMCFTNISC